MELCQARLNPSIHKLQQAQPALYVPPVTNVSTICCYVTTLYSTLEQNLFQAAVAACMLRLHVVLLPNALVDQYLHPDRLPAHSARASMVAASWC